MSPAQASEKTIVSGSPNTRLVPVQRQGLSPTRIRSDYTRSYQAQQKLISRVKPNTQTDKGKPKLTFLEQQDLKDILIGIGRVILMAQIYKASHPIVQDKLLELSSDMRKVIDRAGRLVLSSREDLIFLNGYQERVVGGPLQRLVDVLKFLKVASFEFEKGLTDQEINSFFTLIAAQKRVKVTGDIDIKEQLRKYSITHIRPVFLQYIEVGDSPKDVPRPKNVIVKPGYRLKKAGYSGQEQIIADFLKGKISELPKKTNTFLLDHPKLAALVIIKLIDEYEAQNLDSFSAFQAYVQSTSHYMARISRLIKDPDRAAKTLAKLEKHLVVRLKSLKKERKFITETKKQIKDALSWVEIEQMVSHYERAKKNLLEKEEEIIGSMEKRKVPSVKELKGRLQQIGFFQSKLAAYLKKT